MFAALIVLACSGGEEADASLNGGGLNPDPQEAVQNLTVAASWSEGQLTQGELEETVKTQLALLESEYLRNRHSLLQEAAGQMIIQQVLEAEAAAKGMEVEAMLIADIESRINPPTDAEIAAIYPRVAGRFGGAPLEQVKDQVAALLMDQAKAQVAGAYMAELETRYQIQVDISYPDLPRIEVSADDDPFRGPADAPVTIIEFAEYQCPYCGRAEETINQLVADYPDKIRVVYRDFPLQGHDRAIPAALAANCAGDQGKYWEMHQLLLSNQRALTDTDLRRNAERIALDLDSFDSCMNNAGEKVAEIQADFLAGQSVGVTGTPAFFINGIFLNGALPYDQFKAIIDRELEGS